MQRVPARPLLVRWFRKRLRARDIEHLLAVRVHVAGTDTMPVKIPFKWEHEFIVEYKINILNLNFGALHSHLIRLGMKLQNGNVKLMLFKTC